MIITVTLFIIGLIIICVGGDKFVDNAVSVAKHLGMPEILVGATIVSIGTTLPEILVSTTAAVQGSSAVCAGNAYGSIICNTALIAGIGQLVSPAKKVDPKSFRLNAILFFVYSAFLFVMMYTTGNVGRVAGILLVGGFAFYTFCSLRMTNRESVQAEEKEDLPPLGKSLILMLVFAAALFVGAKLLVDNGVEIAEALGVPERVIAVTFIALGTSLPELVTTITSLIKGHAHLGLGNILGANLLNLLMVMGIPAVILGVPVERATTVIDVPISIFVMLVLLVPIWIRKKGSRVQGACLLGIYAAYCIYSFV